MNTMQITPEVLPLEDVKKEVLEFCQQPHGREDILEHIQVQLNSDNYHRYVATLVKQRFIKTDLLRNRHSTKQKYIITQKGLNYLKAIN
jgi:predicted transcriptional regulator